MESEARGFSYAIIGHERWIGWYFEFLTSETSVSTQQGPIVRFSVRNQNRADVNCYAQPSFSEYDDILCQERQKFFLKRLD